MATDGMEQERQRESVADEPRERETGGIVQRQQYRQVKSQHILLRINVYTHTHTTHTESIPANLFNQN